MKAAANNQTSSSDKNKKQLHAKPQRKKQGLFVIIFIFVALFLLSKHEPVDTIDCTPEIIAKKPDVIMLGAWWCSYCYQAKKYFQRNDIHYCEYDMENTSIGKQLYKENGSGAVPIILIGERRLRGFNALQIENALLSLDKNSRNPK